VVRAGQGRRGDGIARQGHLRHDVPMRFRHELVYDASPDEVHAMLADPAFREATCAAQQVVSVDVDITVDGAGMSVRIDQIQPTQGVPSFAKSIIGETTHAIQIEEWRNNRQAVLDIETPGKPGTMHGTITIEPRGSGAADVVELDIKVGIPLIGGRLENLMGDLVRKAMDHEHRVGIAWLAGERP